MVWAAASPQRSWQVAPGRQRSAQDPGHCSRQVEPALQVALPPAPTVTVQLALASHSMWAPSPAPIEQVLFPWHSATQPAPHIPPVQTLPEGQLSSQPMDPHSVDRQPPQAAPSAHPVSACPTSACPVSACPTSALAASTGGRSDTASRVAPSREFSSKVSAPLQADASQTKAARRPPRTAVTPTLAPAGMPGSRGGAGALRGRSRRAGHPDSG